MRKHHMSVTGRLLQSSCWITVLALSTLTAVAAEQTLFIASSGREPGIYTCSLDTETGQFGPLRLAAGNVRTGFLARHPKLNILYAHTTEAAAPDNADWTGGVRAYRFNADNGQLELLQQVSTQDKGNTHIAVSPHAHAVVVCHYGGLGTSALPLGKDGRITEQVSHIKHHGSSVNPRRQQAPHPHGVAIDPTSRFACVADLGTDRVEVYRLNEKAELTRATSWRAAAGAGPRHVAFHPSGRWLYCINELDSTIATLQFDVTNGRLIERQVVSTLPKDSAVANTTAEVVVHPSGKFLYGSNRGLDSTAVFHIDPDQGTLTLVQQVPTGGKHPRFVGLDPTGHLYIAANMNSDTLMSFVIDQETGKLSATNNSLEVKRPMCVVFAESK